MLGRGRDKITQEMVKSFWEKDSDVEEDYWE